MLDSIDIKKELTEEEAEELDLKINATVDAALDYAPDLKLPSPFLRDFYEDEANRIIWLQESIDGQTLNIAKKIFKYNQLDKGLAIEKRKPVKIFIDTAGGSVSVMWQLINVIRLSKTPIWTINFCDAMSAGSLILAAGHKRFALPGTTVLIHSGSCNYGGNVEQVESAKKYYDEMTKKTDDFLLDVTKINPKEFKKRKSADWYLSAEEALERGVIDKIVDDLDEIL